MVIQKFEITLEAHEMLFAVRFQDDPSKQAIRQQYLQAHIDWLDQHADLVLVGGSLRKSRDDKPIGGLWIVNAGTKDAVQALIEKDPFWIHGLRTSVEILYWSKAFEDRKVPV